uniref:Putative scf ubiquitin ligase skp2 component n=1 Tax=Culex tarsalis TaxID=7177 RepID=A0A1Q3FA96_CULTA
MTTRENRLRKQPSSLYNSCVRYVARNLKRYKNADFLDRIPPMIKNSIILNVTRAQKGFHDDDLLGMLLNRQLTRINLSTSTITDQTLLALAGQCPNLKSLILTQGEYRFTETGLAAIVRCFPQLEQFSVKECALVDDTFVADLARNSPQLDLLDLEACANVTDASAEAIKPLQLTKLNLSRTKISDVFLGAIANERCGGTLEDLNISYCQITGAGLGKLPWETIKYIGFEGCEVEDLEFIGMNKNLKYIQWTIAN